MVERTLASRLDLPACRTPAGHHQDAQVLPPLPTMKCIISTVDGRHAAPGSLSPRQPSFPPACSQGRPGPVGDHPASKPRIPLVSRSWDNTSSCPPLC